jgi:hypothetical protein
MLKLALPLCSRQQMSIAARFNLAMMQLTAVQGCDSDTIPAVIGGCQSRNLFLHVCFIAQLMHMCLFDHVLNYFKSPYVMYHNVSGSTS